MGLSKKWQHEQFDEILQLSKFLDYWKQYIWLYCSFIAHNISHIGLSGTWQRRKWINESLFTSSPFERTDLQKWVGLLSTALLPSRCRAQTSNPRLPGRQRTNQPPDHRKHIPGEERERDGKFGELEREMYRLKQKLPEIIIIIQFR